MSIKLIRSNQYVHHTLKYNKSILIENISDPIEITAWHQGTESKQESSYINAYEDEQATKDVFESKFKYIDIGKVTAIGPRSLLKITPSDTNDNCYLFGEEVLWGKRSSLKEINKYESKSAKTVVNIDEGIILSAPGIHVYGHWLFDFIPRLIFAQAYIEQYPKKSITIVMSQPSEWAEVFMGLFNFDNLLFLRGYEQAIINKAIVPLSFKNGSFVDSFALRATADFIVSNLSGIPESISPKLFVLRRHTTISNQNQIASTLARYGFICLYPEDLSIEQQVALFKNAKIVIGEDGSALHNLIFNETSSSTLVVFPREGRHNLWHTSVVKSVQAKLIIHDVVVDHEGKTSVDINSLIGLIEKLVPQ